MNPVRAKLGENGRVIIPASFRQKLHWSSGDNIILHINNNEISITTPKEALSKLQMKVKTQMEKIGNISLVDELIANRRKEADNE